MNRIVHVVRKVLLVAFGGVLVACCGNKAPAAPSSSSQAFTPNPAAVPVGQTVVFRNNSGGTHRIVADNGAWDAGTIAPGGTSSPISVNSASAVSYHCTIHSSMMGGIN